MERTPARKTKRSKRSKRTEKVFRTNGKTITVTELPHELFRVVCLSDGGWSVTKVLGKRKAAWFILRCTKRLTRKELQKPAKVSKIRTLAVEEGQFKMNGTEWISFNLLHGVRPIILRAPEMFKHQVVYIEPTGENEMFSIRVVDPVSDARSRPIEVTRAMVDSMVRTLNQPSHEHEPGDIHRG